MKRVAFMFPGQGSQTVGMGKAIYDAYPEVRHLFDQANEVLGKDLTDLMFNGPDTALTATENAQPALVLASSVIQTLLAQAGVKPTMVIGHSLGEYSAHVAAGTLALEDALQLVTARGQLMEGAFPAGQGTMAAVLGLSVTEIEAALTNLNSDGIVDIANINCPGQVVISGTQKGIDLVTPLLTEAGARRVIPLNVSGPFHSQLMKPASEAFAKKLETVQVNEAMIPVYVNVTSQPVFASEEIKALLVKQLYSPVQFEASIEQMIDEGVDAFVEVGPGKVLSGLVRKINRRTKTFNIQDEASLDAFLQWYKEDD